MAPNPADPIDRLLADLSSVYTTASQGAARFVAGPSGVFVLVSGGDDLGQAAERAARLAAVTRTALADHLSWVPFVDAVVVTAAGAHRRPAGPANEEITVHATAVPLDLLGEVLVEGRAVIDDAALDVIGTLVGNDALVPWRTESGPGSDKIDLCEPTANSTAKA
jgi:hypothetical protein